MRPQAVPGPPADPEQICDAFLTQSVAQVAEGESRKLLAAATELRRTNEVRALALKKSFLLMMSAFALYGMTLATLFLLKVMEG